jgi:hypothetical protein
VVPIRPPATTKLAHIAAPIALAALPWLAPGCDGGDEAEKGGDPVPSAGVLTPDTVRECPTRIEGPRLSPDSDDVFAGPIVFYGLGDAAARDPSDYRDLGRGRYQTVKTITEVEANAVVTVAVPPSERDLALSYRIAYKPARLSFIAPLSELERTVEFKACAASHPRGSGPVRLGPRTQFNGGFISAGPGCRTFQVFPRQDAGPIQVRVGFGTGRRAC